MIRRRKFVYFEKLQKLKVGNVEKVDLDLFQAIKQYDNWLEFFCRSVFLFRSISERSVVVKFRSRSQFKNFRIEAGV